MVSRVLARKLRRDIWRQRAQFLAVIVVVAIGIAVFVAASDAYRNLKGSFDAAYSSQRLPDVVLTGPSAWDRAEAAASLPGAPLVTERSVADTGARVGEHTLLVRVVTVPDGDQPDVSRLAIRSGQLPGSGEVLVEQHLADHFGLAMGDTVALSGAAGWTTVRVAGTGLSTEYFWPARSQQETMTSAEQFGVVFAGTDLLDSLGLPGDRQLALYSTDRAAATALAAEATALGRTSSLTVQTRDDQPSYVALDQDVKTFGEFASLLPVLFLIAADVGAFILLSRLVHAQRAIIGTLVANGISPRALRHHYLGYGLLAGGAAAVPGSVAGLLLGRWYTSMYTRAIGLPVEVATVHPATLIAGIGGGIAATVLAAWGPAVRAARTTPSEAMRITAPRRGRRSLLERVVPPLRHVPTRWRMVVRSFGRNPRRAAFTVIGVAMSLCLVLVFAGLRDTVANVLDRQYGTVDRSDGQLYAASGEVQRAIAAARADPSVAVAEPFTRIEVTLTAGSERFDTLLLGLPAQTTMHRFVGVGGGELTLPRDGGLLLGVGLRRLLDVHVGDEVRAVVADGTVYVDKVAGFVDEPLSAAAYGALEHLDALAGRSTAVGALVRLNAGADPETTTHRLGSLPGVAAYFDNRALEATMRDAFAIMDVLVGIMLVFAAVMAIALLYNAMSANLAERSVELGTLHAAGLTRGMLVRMAAAENVLLTVAGIPLGVASGIGLARWFMSTYENLGYRWELRMNGSTVLWVCAAVLVAASLSQLSVVRRVRHIDVAAIVRERSL